LLQLAPDELGQDPSDAERALTRMIAALPAARAGGPRGTHQTAVAQSTPRPASPAPTVGSPTPRRTAPATPRPRAERSRGEMQTLGVMAGLALAGLGCLELYVAVADAALGSGRVLLALGIALDAWSRVLGALAAERAGQADWAWGCAIFGSPAAAAFALSSESETASVEAAPLAGIVGAAAVLIVVAAVLLGA
jgi:hypothetical protein